MWDHLWDFFVDTCIAFFMPMVCSYFAISGDLFLSVSACNATGFEEMGNVLLTPVQYLVAGREAIQREDGSWEFVQKYDYSNVFWAKAVASIVAIPASITLGVAIKGLSYLSSETRTRHASMAAAWRATQVHSNIANYQAMGIQVGDLKKAEFFTSEGYQRRAGDENHLKNEREALREVGKILTEAGIPWWVDCGTLLGAYRYGGVIPWDEDIDMSILLPDFENARRALNKLDPKKYLVQDWSGRDFPKTFFKIYIRETGHCIDIETYKINQKKQEISSIFSMENNVFFFEWWKIRERRFKEPIAFSSVFPLKKGMLDTVEVLLPRDPKPFLQRYYGENLAPAKIYDPHTGRFEKDLNHPYWQRAYVH